MASPRPSHPSQHTLHNIAPPATPPSNAAARNSSASCDASLPSPASRHITLPRPSQPCCATRSPQLQRAHPCTACSARRSHGGAYQVRRHRLRGRAQVGGPRVHLGRRLRPPGRALVRCAAERGVAAVQRAWQALTQRSHTLQCQGALSRVLGRAARGVRAGQLPGDVHHRQARGAAGRGVRCAAAETLRRRCVRCAATTTRTTRPASGSARCATSCGCVFRASGTRRSPL